MTTLISVCSFTFFLVLAWAFVDQIFKLVEFSFAYFKGKNYEN